jgi:hypothetical protein
MFAYCSELEPHVTICTMLEDEKYLKQLLCPIRHVSVKLPLWDEMLIIFQIPLFIFNDLVCALLPLSFINKIHRPLREKVVLVLLMGSGLFASACAIIKIWRISHVPIKDPTYDSIILGVWAHLEQIVGIIVACVPCLKALFETVMLRLGLSTQASVSSYRNPKPLLTGSSSNDPNMRLNKIESHGGDTDEQVMLPTTQGSNV